MDSGYRPEGNGCLMWIAALLVTGFVLMMMAGGDDTTQTSANAEVLSRNQANIASDVYNSYYNCLAAGACVSHTTQTTTSTTSTSTDITGDRNTVNNGLRLCVDANGGGYWTYELCGAGYTETTPPAGVTP